MDTVEVMKNPNKRKKNRAKRALESCSEHVETPESDTKQPKKKKRKGSRANQTENEPAESVNLGVTSSPERDTEPVHSLTKKQMKNIKKRDVDFTESKVQSKDVKIKKNVEKNIFSKKCKKEIADIDGEPILTKYTQKLDNPDTSDQIDTSDDEDMTDSSEEENGEVPGKNEDMTDDEDMSDSSEEENNSHGKVPGKKIIPDSPDKVNRTLFFGNVPISMNRKEVKRVFRPFGEIESIRFRNAVPTKLSIPKKVADIKHKYNENSSSLKGFVVFKNQKDAETALCLNGNVVNGNHLRVDKMKVSQIDVKTSVFVGNLPFTLKDEDLWNAFADCGTIQNVRVIRDSVHGMGKGFAFVNFQEESAVQAALALNNTEIAGRQMRVKVNDAQAKSKTRPTQSKKSSPVSKQDARKRMRFLKFQKKQKEDGSRKTIKKLKNQKKQAHEKKKIASLFKD